MTNYDYSFIHRQNIIEFTIIIFDYKKTSSSWLVDLSFFCRYPRWNTCPIHI